VAAEAVEVMFQVAPWELVVLVAVVRDLKIVALLQVVQLILAVAEVVIDHLMAVMEHLVAEAQEL
jgi:hypothetical protein